MRVPVSIVWLLLAILCAARSAQADITATAPQLSARLVVPPQAVYPGQRFTAGLYFKLQPGWHVYWSNAGDSGQPSSMRWALPAGISAGALEFPAPRRLPLGPLMDFGYENEVLFPIPVRVASSFTSSAPTVALGGEVSWLVCREVCIPGRAPLSVERPVLRSMPSAPTTTDDAQLISRFQRAVPRALPPPGEARFAAAGNALTLDVVTGQREAEAQFFPLDQNLIANAAPQPLIPLRNGFRLTLTKDENLGAAPGALRGVVVLGGGRAYVINATPGVIAGADGRALSGLAGVVLFAFVGGLILNLMPCVFPVLFIKALSLVGTSSAQRHQLRRHSLVYASGVLVSFWIIVAALVALRGAGQQLGWGFQFQSAGFLCVIALLLFFLGLSLAGLFELGLTFSGAGSNLAARGGYAGSFFTGVLAVIVATPCTAPFMGAAVGFALAQSGLVTFVVFTAIALGLALPYLLLAFNPAWTRLLPKPGPWMELLKQAASLPVFATVIWLVWVFNQSAGGVGLVALLSGFLLVAVAGWVLGRWPARLGASLAAVAIAACAVAVPLAAGGSSGGPPASSTSSGDGTWQAFSPQSVQRYRAEGRTVFVDFTASWCLSCQVNERLVLNRGDVQRRLRESGVVLVRADWTRRDAVIAQTLAGLGRSGVPTYVLYPSDPDAAPKVLPEVLTAGILLDALATVQGAAAPRVARKN